MRGIFSVKKEEQLTVRVLLPELVMPSGELKLQEYKVLTEKA